MEDSMRTTRLLLAAVVLTVALPSIAWAQTGWIDWTWKWWPDKEYAGPKSCPDGTQPVSEYCQHEYDVWLKGEMDYREHRSLYLNHTHVGGFRTSVKPRPSYPEWMPMRCAPEEYLAFKSPICASYFEAEDYEILDHVLGPEAQYKFSTRITFTMADGTDFWDFMLRNTHISPVWTNSSNGPRTWGYLGIHATIGRFGKRIYIWGLPGVIILRYPDGKKDVKMTYGADVFIADLRVPGTQHKLPMFVTFAKVFSGAEMEAFKKGADTGMNMIGFNFTLKK